MLVVKVELHSAVTGQISEIARAVIYNDGGGDREHGNYKALTIRGRSKDAFDARMRGAIREGKNVTRETEITNYPRLRLHVWNLVAKALGKMGYGHGKDQPEGWD